MNVLFGVPSTQPTFSFGIFDGDHGGLWDTAVDGFTLTFTLYGDPLGDGSTLNFLGQWTNADFPDDAWLDIPPIANGAAAQSPSGNFLYRLTIEGSNQGFSDVTVFKVRTADTNSLSLRPQAFNFIGALFSFDDLAIVYPDFPNLTPTTYDGMWTFYVRIPMSTNLLELWDGDLDHGNAVCTTFDTDDPDTPGFPFLPPWAASGTSEFEGVANGEACEGGTSTGAPPDDFGLDLFVRHPDVQYQVTDPLGNVYLNDNPSGNLEWERFSLSTNPLEDADYHVASLPAGIYTIQMSGMDLANFNSWFIPEVVGVCTDGTPSCMPEIHPLLLGDYVWRDDNHDGNQDSGEPGIDGVLLELLDANGGLISTAPTSGGGLYRFPVEPGTYTVRVAASNFNAGGALEGLSSTTGGETRSNTLTTDNDFTFDFGYVGEEPQGSLGDRVWRDDNGNGVQESGEPGLNGVTVRLHDSGGAVIATQVTAGDGNYSFTGLAAGSYTVEVMAATLPAGSVQTYDLDGTGTANTAAATLAAGQNRTDVDFGYRQLGSLGDRVWRDDNGNGAQDSGEPGLNGVTVRLRDGANAVIATQVTAGDGNYSFGALPAGTYKVEVDSTTLPSNSVQTYDLDGIATPNVATASLAGGENRTDVDFGYQQRVSLGDRVWMDDDGDTVQDVGEPGLSGVTVRLFNSSNVQVGTQVTTGSGIYFFSDLVAGTYRVVVDSTTLPAGAVQTYDLDGLATPHAATVTLAPGQSRTDVDFGYRLSNASVGDRVWSDLDGDGVQDAGEPGINGVTVQLLSSAGAVLATQVTAGDGQYTFTNLFSGNYSVRVVSSTLPSGATQTYDLDGLSTAHIASFALATSQNRTDVDFGYRLVQVGGEGCTPGYWKQPQHFDSWVIYSPNDSFNAVFGVNASGNPTLLTALRAGGGGYAALGRHAVAALLNAVSNGVNYQYSTSEVIALVRQAYASGDPEPIKNQLAAQNEIGCPLN